MDKEQTIRVFEKWLKAINSDKGLEFEVKYRDRFSNHELHDFISGISPGIHKRVIDALNERCEKQSSETDATDVMDVIITKCNDGQSQRYTNQSLFDDVDEQFDNVRLTFYDDSDTPPDMIQKTRLKLPGVKNSVFSQGFKLSLSKESDVASSSKLYEEYLAYTTSNRSSMLIREKERWSYIIHFIDDDKHKIPIIQIDLTKVNSWISNNLNSADITFELEMEYIGNRYWEFMPTFDQSSTQIDTNKLIEEINKNSFKVAKIFVNELKYLLALVQQSEVLIDVNVHNSIYLAYLTLIGQHDGREVYSTKTNGQRDVFIGCQPETLHIRHLPTVLEDDYIALDKSDGERMLMFVHERSIYLVDRFIHINKLEATLHIDDLNNSLLDGEWIVDNEGNRMYLVFDALFLQKNDIRTHSTLNRLKFVQQIMQAINGAKSDFSSDEQPKKILDANFKFELKPFVRWPKEQTGDVAKLLDRPYPTDGLIFVPNTGCPKTRKWSTLFKWKPPNLNTIDLYVERGEGEENVYRLFIQTNLIVFNRDLYILLKNENKTRWIVDENNNVTIIQQSDISKEQGDLKYLHNQNIMIPFPFQCTVQHDTELLDGCVYEFYYDYEKKTLMPLHLRYDKSTKGYRGSNHLTVAVDIWDSIRNPVTRNAITNLTSDSLSKEDIITRTMRSKDVPDMFSESFELKSVFARYHTKSDSGEDSPIWRMRKFHGYVKNELIQRYCTRPNRVEFEAVLTRLGGRKDQKSVDCYELPNNETVISSLNSLLGITRKQLKFSSKNKNKIILSQNIVQHLIHSTINGMNNVLDIGFGKGGDLWKYAKSGITNLVGVENESFLLSGANDCALTRISEVKKG